jgi:hypothetical protein
MAAPATTARSTPLGIPLGDGYSTKIAFALDPDISFWEKTVAPGGWDGGDAIEATTMHNATYRTFRSRSLVTLNESSTTVAYDPDVYDEILAIINVEGSITVHFPDGSTLDFFGYLRTFEPSDNEEGTQPEATITIQPTNWDPANNVEQGPVLTEVSGT